MPKKASSLKNARVSAHINPSLKPFLVSVAALKPDPKNPRTHSKRNIEAIKASLTEYGQQTPLITKAGVVLKGNGTLAAAKELGWHEIAAVEFHIDKKAKVKGYRIADNRSAELASWAYQTLTTEMTDLKSEGEDLNVLGFTLPEFEALSLSTPWAGTSQGDVTSSTAPKKEKAEASVVLITILNSKREQEIHDSLKRWAQKFEGALLIARQ